MPTIWNFDIDDTTNSGGGNTFFRVNHGRAETNTRPDLDNEGGLRIENEDGIELWLSVDPTTSVDASGVSNGYMAWINESGSVGTTNGGLFPDRQPEDGDDGQIYFASENGTGNLDANSPDPDIFIIAPSERDENGDYDGRFVGTTDDPVALNFSTGLGIWEVTFHKEDGTTEVVLIGDEDRFTDPFTSLMNWEPQTASAVGTFTHITVKPLTAPLNPNKGTVFQLDDISMAEYFCFLRGTLISTPKGERTVEELQPGDIVLTADGREVAVKWLGYQTLSTDCATTEHLAPVLIKQGALGDGLPRRDLYVTADHAMLVDDILINASVLVNHDSIQWVSAKDFGREFTIYHVETEAQEVILAEGAPSETFVDVASRKHFDNYSEYLDRYGVETPIQELPYARVSSQRLLPEWIRMRLRQTGGAKAAETQAVA